MTYGVPDNQLEVIALIEANLEAASDPHLILVPARLFHQAVQKPRLPNT